MAGSTCWTSGWPLCSAAAYGTVAPVGDGDGLVGVGDGDVLVGVGVGVGDLVGEGDVLVGVGVGVGVAGLLWCG